MEIPAIGFGTYLLEDVESNIKCALDVGYKHIDTAHGYGNETEIGKVLKTFNRKELFITTKLWGTDHFRVKEAFQESLDALDLEYVDLFLIHWPIALVESKEHFPTDKNGKVMSIPTDLVKTWKDMESLVKAGKVRHIGVSNFNISHLELILNNPTIKPYANQIELHPYCYPSKLVEYMRSKDIKIIAYSSLGASSCNYMTHPVLLKESEKYKLTVPQLLLSWAYSKGFHVIPKSNTPSRIKENLKIMKIETDKLDKLHLEKQLRVFNPIDFFHVDIKYE